MPSSNRRIEASQINGALSHGPITEAGRHAVALNAVTHGLTAQTVILQTEPADEYHAEWLNYVDQYRPQGMSEQALVRQLVSANWRLTRYAGVESGMFNNKMNQQAAWVDQQYPNISDKDRVAIAFESLADNGNSLALANRYQARLQNENQKILKSLSQMQATHCAAEVKLPNKHQTNSNKPSPENKHSPEIVPAGISD